MDSPKGRPVERRVKGFEGVAQKRTSAMEAEMGDAGASEASEGDILALGGDAESWKS